MLVLAWKLGIATEAALLLGLASLPAGVAAMLVCAVVALAGVVVAVRIIRKLLHQGSARQGCCLFDLNRRVSKR